MRNYSIVTRIIWRLEKIAADINNTLQHMRVASQLQDIARTEPPDTAEQGDGGR